MKNMGFKFLVFFEFNPEELDEMLDRYKEIQEDSEWWEQHEGKRKTLFPNHMIMGDLPTLTKPCKSVVIVEVEDPDFLAKSRARALPDGPWHLGKFVLLEDNRKIMEEYQKLKK